jgi:hypothetical protein
MTTIPTDLHPETRLTTAQVAAITNISRSSFDKWRRLKNGGPPCENPTPQIVRYKWGSVIAWLNGTATPPAA